MKGITVLLSFLYWKYFRM